MPRWRCSSPRYWSSPPSSSAPYPLALVFNGFELGAILLAVLIANYVTQDGESTWFEGVQLLAVYLVFGIAFYFA